MITCEIVHLRLRRLLVLLLLISMQIHPAQNVATAQAEDELIQPRGDAALSGVMPGEGPTDVPDTLWKYGPGAGITMGMASDGAALYVVTKKPGALVALNTGEGTVRWTVNAGDTAFGPALTEQLAVISVWSESGNSVVAVDRDTGEEAWRVEVAGLPTAPTAADGTIYIAAGSTLDAASAVLALDAVSGDELWTHETPGSYSLGDLVSVDDGVVLTSGYGDEAGLYALDEATGDELWQLTDTTEVTFDPAVGDGVAVIMDLPTVWGLDLRTGEQLWQLSGASSGGGVAVSSDAAIIGLNQEVRAVDPRSGDVLWSAPITGIGGPPVIAGELVYIAAWRPSDEFGAHMLYAFDIVTGDEQWSQELAFQVPGNQPIVDNGVLFLDGSGGMVVALGDQEQAGSQESTPSPRDFAGGSYHSDEFGIAIDWNWPWRQDLAESRTEDGSDSVTLIAGTTEFELTASSLDLGRDEVLAAMLDLRERGTDAFQPLGQDDTRDYLAATTSFEIDGVPMIEQIEVRELSGGGLVVVRLTAPAASFTSRFDNVQAQIEVDGDPPFGSEPIGLD